MITVALDGTGDYTSIQEAIDSIPKVKRRSNIKASASDESSSTAKTDSSGSCSLDRTIFIKNGTYTERVEIYNDNIILIGESVYGVKITKGYYANMLMEDGSKRGTFRSYTCLINANNVSAYNITFENSAGFGKEVGQAIALYAEGDHLIFKNCHIYGHQDTLFTGPLPYKEYQPGGFTGPTKDAKRRLCRQLYEDCFISGEVDFIFGSATCYFKNCTIYAIQRAQEVISSYLTAPSTYEGQKFGYVFDTCKLTGNCTPRSVSMGRPWRNFAQSVFLNCTYSDQIIDEGFSDWNKEDAHNTMFFAEYNGSGDGYKPASRASYVKQLTSKEAESYTKERVLELPW